MPLFNRIVNNVAIVKILKIKNNDQFNRHHVKYEQFLLKCGYPLRKKQKNYWKNWETIKKLLIPICDKFGCFPPNTFLRKINSSLVSSLYNYHGGLIKTAKKNWISNGYWILC